MPAKYERWSGAAAARGAHDTVRKQTLSEIERRVFRKDGIVGRVTPRAAPNLGADGSIRESFGIDIDVTARRRAEAAQSLPAAFPVMRPLVRHGAPHWRRGP
ncbi:MAG: hypothetical protein V2I65_20635 [Paracoccaceae bacterium]|jgi:hypothetical protein|nr:hypothetical protein [Paracoccaceae bacterium]